MSKKATNRQVSADFLRHRAECSVKAGYAKQKWVFFCERMLSLGLTCTLYEARQTVSKYITVSDGKRSYKVRFSNHAPICRRELAGDCDFFVGHTNLKVTTTNQAINATLNFFSLEDKPYTPPPVEQKFAAPASEFDDMVFDDSGNDNSPPWKV